MTNKERTANKKNLSRNLHKLLSNAHFSVRQAAKLCNIPLRTFESYYYGEKLPNSKNFAAIGKLFRMTPQALISANYSKAVSYERQLYNDVSNLYDELTVLTPEEIITDMLAARIPCHKTFYQLCKMMEFEIEYCPTYSRDFIKKALYNIVDDFNQIDLAQKVTKNKLRHLTDDIVKQRIAEGITEEEALAQCKTRLEIAEEMLEDFQKTILKQSDDVIYRSKSRQYFVDQYNEGAFDGMPLEEIPLHIQVNNREYNCKDLQTAEVAFLEVLKKDFAKKFF